jgi:hypothetical protein
MVTSEWGLRLRLYSCTRRPEEAERISSSGWAARAVVAEPVRVGLGHLSPFNVVHTGLDLLALLPLMTNIRTTIPVTWLKVSGN